MDYSLDGLHLTEQFEGCKLAAYQDGGGRWTIGYGHAEGVSEGDICTQEQAEAWLREDIAWASNFVDKEVTVALTQGEFDALTDFVFNAGSGNFASSTMLRLLNEGNLDGAAAEFQKWDHCNGEVVAGLLRRRIAEQQEFQT